MRLMKRPRVASSSSVVDVQGKQSGLKTTELHCSRRTAQKTSHDEGQSCRTEEGILRAASPETVTERYDHVKGPLGCFLESCYLCKKKLLKGKDVYMYGVLHGFCSPECRAYQMETDKAAEKVAEKLKGVGIQCSNTKKR